jgi:hypothetical protein
MKKRFTKQSVLAIGLMLILLVGTVSADSIIEDFEAGIPADWTLDPGGVAGTDVAATNIAPTNGSFHGYITSQGATTDMTAYGGSNGTILTSAPFTLTPGDTLYLDLHALGNDYIDWPDRAIVELLDSGGGVYATLFTASVSDNNQQAVPCTNCGYSISPGVTLVPATANWGPTTLDAGPVGGTVYGTEAGNSVGTAGWVSVAYSPADTDVYRLRFIVANYNDNGYDMALAIDYIRSVGPTAVELLSFSAAPHRRAIQLAWETASEIDNVGFNLYRSESPEGARVQLNAALIPSRNPGSPTGAVYTFLDETVERGVTYYYWLEDVDLYGTATLHGPVRAIIRPKARPVQPAIQPVATEKDRP